MSGSTTKYEFARVLATGAASILQPNLGRVGGLLEAKKIAGMAEAYYAQIAPHLYCGPVVGAANLHLAACSPNILVVEGIQRWDGFHAEILRQPIEWEDGYVIPPSGPGLGVELDEDVAAANPYDGDELHLMPPTSRSGVMRVGFVGVGRLGAPPRREPRACRVPARGARPRRGAAASARRGAGATLGRARLPQSRHAARTPSITCLPSPVAVAAVVEGDDGS